jgi:hypothetical protein
MRDLAVQSCHQTESQPHVKGASIGSKWIRRIEVLIVGISLLEWSRRVALSFLGAQRGRSPIWVKS